MSVTIELYFGLWVGEGVAVESKFGDGRSVCSLMEILKALCIVLHSKMDCD